ncbi:unnamed protein product [Ceutorhynchus assimilis]|uniref:Zinc finger PHD-type domain-containing protein n=1 Tax=Ceutorhynchus assimilis TaxID=467358 RepID=A0A9N9MI70_9CUCU|nr:unnamed protein product [Ceutorhynchus assimilis]
MTRASYCGECNTRVAKQCPNFQCVECKKWYHSVTCTKITEVEERLLSEQKKPWCCKKCKRLTITVLGQNANRESSSNISRRISSIPEGKDLDSIYSLLLELKTEMAVIHKDMDEVKTSLDFLHGMYDEQRQINKVMSDMIEETRGENKKLREELSLVQSKLLEIEADKVSTMLMINGAFDKEDTEKVLLEKSLKVLNFVDNSINKEHLGNIKTIPVKNKAPIVSVSLTKSEMVKNILKKRREVGILNTHSCGINTSNTTIYIPV